MGIGDLSYPEGRLGTLLRSAALGRFPPADGVTEVLAAPVDGPVAGACVGFTAHSVIALDVDEDLVRARLAEHSDALAAPLAPDVLLWLGERAGLRPGIVDVALAAVGTGTRVPDGWIEAEVDHPRVHRALRRRSEVRSFATDAGVVTIGRGLANRWEVAIELDTPSGGMSRGRTPAPAARTQGRSLIAAALGLVPAGEPLFAQVSPGNARSLRSFLAAGFQPIGSEVLFHP